MSIKGGNRALCWTSAGTSECQQEWEFRATSDRHTGNTFSPHVWVQHQIVYSVGIGFQEDQLKIEVRLFKNRLLSKDPELFYLNCLLHQWGFLRQCSKTLGEHHLAFPTSILHEDTWWYKTFWHSGTEPSHHQVSATYKSWEKHPGLWGSRGGWQRQKGKREKAFKYTKQQEDLGGNAQEINTK
jgi:hypothetical protein